MRFFAVHLVLSMSPCFVGLRMESKWLVPDLAALALFYEFALAAAYPVLFLQIKPLSIEWRKKGPEQND
jgi:hypothetical protein